MDDRSSREQLVGRVVRVNAFDPVRGEHGKGTATNVRVLAVALNNGSNSE
jgi:hypothetical protein